MANEESIPPAWLENVCKILHSGDLRKIEWTFEASNQWQLQSNGAWLPDCHEAMEQALSVPSVKGVRIELREKGETYAFWYFYKNRQFYGKICLRADKLRIKLVSAHLPEKGTTRL